MLARALLLAALYALIAPSGAWAHASLSGSEPADGDVLATAPKAVRFTFTDEVRRAPGIKAIRNDGRSVLAGEPRVVNGRVLVVPLRSGLGEGDYTILWRVLADDGHALAGVISFAVGAGRAPPTPALSVDTGPSAGDVMSRLLFFAGLLTAAGAAFFRFAVGPVPVRLLLGAFLLVFVGVSGALHDVPVSTRFGTVMAVAAIVAATGALLAAIAPLYPLLEPLPFVLALCLLPAPSLAGHALDSGRPRIEVVVDVFHVAAASFWLGGLVALAVALRARETRDAILRRFSNLALASVVVLAATGVIRAFSELNAVSQLWSTGYGRILVAKTALLTLLVAIGWVNRYRLIPRMSLAGLRRNVGVSLALFAGLVAAVALLTELRPGRDRIAVAAVREAIGAPPLPATDAMVQARQDGERAVALALDPPRAEVTVLGPDGLGVNGLSVTIGGASTRACGPGCYRAFAIPLGTVGVSIEGRRLTFAFPPEVRRADALVARATRAFRALRSVDYVERLASSPRNRIVADFTLERPNKLEYRIRGGASGIVIGSRRWDRAPGADWQRSAQTPLPQPEPIWAGGVTNAYVLENTASDYVVSFLNRNGPAWFTIRFNRHTMLPRELAMVAAAHFMAHRYTRFNAPLRIRAPGAGR